MRSLVQIQPKEKIKISPHGVKIAHDSSGIFLGFNDKKDRILEKFLDGFHLKEDEDEYHERNKLKTISYKNVKKLSLIKEKKEVKNILIK